MGLCRDALSGSPFIYQCRPACECSGNDYLKDKFGSSNALQSLTHVLTLGEEAADLKCSRTKNIYEELSVKGCKLSKYKELDSLGILVLTTQDVDKITEEIREVYQVLIEKKGFGKWS